MNQTDPFHNCPIYEVLEEMTNEQLMMNMIKNLNNNDLTNLMFVLDRCTELTQQKWLQIYNKMQIKW